MANEVLSKLSDGVLELMLNRPDEGNAILPEMAIELRRLVHEGANSAEVILLRGAGADFSVGRVAGPEASDTVQAEFAKLMLGVFEAIHHSSIPVIAAVHGRAFGHGCGIAAVCDITLAADDATFQVPERAYRVLPTMAISSFIDRIPRKAFTYLLYSNALIRAERALSYGIVSDVVPAHVLDDTVRAIAAAVVKSPRGVNRAVKKYARAAFGMHAEGAVDFAREIHAAIAAGQAA